MFVRDDACGGGGSDGGGQGGCSGGSDGGGHDACDGAVMVAIVVVVMAAVMTPVMVEVMVSAAASSELKPSGHLIYIAIHRAVFIHHVGANSSRLSKTVCSESTAILNGFFFSLGGGEEVSRGRFPN